LTFELPRAARVLFVVKQVSPVCKVADRFVVRGHAGLNRIRFPRRASGPQLDPGTYRITARTPAGRLVSRETIVVVDSRAPTRAQLAEARNSNVCSSADRLASGASGSPGASNTSSGPSPQGEAPSSTGQPSASGPGGRPNVSGAVLGTSVEKAARAASPIFLALLLVSILLLGIASLPGMVLPASRANELIAQHRVEIAGLGAAAFLAVVLAFLLG
jgi:hypothetical protein